MASRLYFANAAAGFTPSTFRGSWTTSASAVTKALTTAPSGAATTIGVAEANATNPYKVCLGRWVSGAVVQSGTLSGKVSWAIGMLESNSAASHFLHVHIYVTVGASSTVRGTLLTDFISSTQNPTAAAGVSSLDQTISSLAVTAGDLIVVEIGYNKTGTSSTSRTSTMNYGNTGTVDLTGGNTAVTTEPGWVQFSDPNRVIPGPLQSQPRNLATNPACGSGSAAGWTAGPNVSGTAGSVTGFSRTTGLNFTVTSGSTGDVLTVGPQVPAAAGEVWVASGQFSCTHSRSTTVYFDFRDANGAYLSAPAGFSLSISSTPQEVDFGSFTAPANTASIDISQESATSGFSVGDVISMSGIQYDQSASAFTAYNDGDSSGWSWDGTAELSTSHQSASNVTGTAAAPLGSLISTATGKPTVLGTAAAPLGSLVSTATDIVNVTGTAAAPLGSLTSSAAGSVSVNGAASAALDFTSTATGVRGVTGSAAAPLGALTSTASGAPVVGGTAAALLGSLVSSATSTVAVAGSAAALLGGVSAAAGTVEVLGTAAAQLGGSTAAIGAVSVTGSAHADLAFSSAAAGVEVVLGSAAAPLGSLDSSAAGTVEVIGSAAALLDFTSSAASGGNITGTAAAPLGSLDSTASGAVDVTGTAAAQLGSLVSSATGTPEVVGGGSASFGGAFAALGVVTVLGAAAGPLGFSGQAAGRTAVSGTASATLDFTSTATGAPVVLGTAAAPLGGLSSIAAGLVIVDGVAAALFSFTSQAGSTRGLFGSGTALLVFESHAHGEVVSRVHFPVHVGELDTTRITGLAGVATGGSSVEVASASGAGFGSAGATAGSVSVVPAVTGGDS